MLSARLHAAAERNYLGCPVDQDVSASRLADQLGKSCLSELANGPTRVSIYDRWYDSRIRTIASAPRRDGGVSLVENATSTK